MKQRRTKQKLRNHEMGHLATVVWSADWELKDKYPEIHSKLLSLYVHNKYIPATANCELHGSKKRVQCVDVKWTVTNDHSIDALVAAQSILKSCKECVIYTDSNISVDTSGSLVHFKLRLTA